MTAIYGAGWHGKEVWAILRDCANIQLDENRRPTVFIDRDVRAPVFGVPVLRPAVMADPDFLKRHDIIVAIGDNSTRTMLSQKVLSLGGRLATIIHPTAINWSRHPIGEGTVVFPNAIISVEAKVGRYCIINKHATVGHGAELGDGVNMADASVCSGKVGDRSFLGFHAAVLPGINIGMDATVGAGAVVTKHVVNNSTVTGVPARPK